MHQDISQYIRIGVDTNAVNARHAEQARSRSMHFDQAPGTAAAPSGGHDDTDLGGDTLDGEVAIELKRLQTAAREIGELAARAHRTQGAAVALAWLRRITREVDRLQACWHGSLQVLATPPTPDPPPRRRRDETGFAPRSR